MKVKFLSMALGTALAVTGASTALAAPPAPGGIDEFVRGLDYDPTKVLTRVGDEITSVPPTTGKLDGGRFTVVERHKRDLKSGTADLAAVNAAADAVFPGALVRVDSTLVEGRPTVLSAPRGPATISVDLPGMVGASNAITVPQATKAVARGAVSSLLERWNADIAPKYPNIAANYSHDLADAYSSLQLQSKLGFGVEAVADKLDIDFEAISSGKKQATVASFRQIFYTASVDEPTAPSDFFAKGTGVSALTGQGVSAAAPPGYVSSVSYGRQIFVKMETTSTSTKVKAAFKAVYEGQKIEPGTEIDRIVKSSSFRGVVLGGSAPGHIKVLSGSLDTMRAAIEKESNYNRENPGSPISYTVRFLKDNRQAAASTVGQYVETTVTSYTEGRLVLNHTGAYVARFAISWDEVSYDERGARQVKRVDWSGNHRHFTSGYSVSIPLPANATNISVWAAEQTGLAWEGWRTVVDEKNLPQVNKRTISIWGSTLAPQSSNVVTES